MNVEIYSNGTVSNLIAEQIQSEYVNDDELEIFLNKHRSGMFGLETLVITIVATAVGNLLSSFIQKILEKNKSQVALNINLIINDEESSFKIPEEIEELNKFIDDNSDQDKIKNEIHINEHSNKGLGIVNRIKNESPPTLAIPKDELEDLCDYYLLIGRDNIIDNGGLRKLNKVKNDGEFINAAFFDVHQFFDGAIYSLLLWNVNIERMNDSDSILFAYQIATQLIMAKRRNQIPREIFEKLGRFCENALIFLNVKQISLDHKMLGFTKKVKINFYKSAIIFYDEHPEEAKRLTLNCLENLSSIYPYNGTSFQHQEIFLVDIMFIVKKLSFFEFKEKALNLLEKIENDVKHINNTNSIKYWEWEYFSLNFDLGYMENCNKEKYSTELIKVLIEKIEKGYNDEALLEDDMKEVERLINIESNREI